MRAWGTIAVRISRFETTALGGVALASLTCLLMLAARMAYSGTRTHVWLSWNLFLAWVPLVASWLIYRLRVRGGARRLRLAALGIVWLAFYPNAPYLVTDLMHIQAGTAATLWLDVLVVFLFALTGLLAGFVSLYMLQDLIARARGARAGWAFVLVVLGLSGVGVYLGRFERWNSWDLFVQPWAVAADVLNGLLYPLAHMRSLAFSGLFAAFLALCYVVLFTLTRLRPQTA